MLQRLVTRSVASVFLLAACSSDSTDTPPPAPTPPPVDDGSIVGDIRQSVTWENGTVLGGVIRIVEGTTVTIAPGAKLSCKESAQIVIGGTLKVASTGEHAAISCAKWTGIIVGQNGSLDIDGLDLDNPETGFETTRGAGSCVVKNSKVTNAPRPFKVGAGSKLTVDHVTATTPTQLGPFDKSVTEVFGNFEATYLDYNAGPSEGIMLIGRDAEATITDSTLKATNGKDLVSAYDKPDFGRPKSLKVSYTSFDGAHCGPHLQGVINAEFDHLTSKSNLFGITIYDAGKVLIKDSNMDGLVAWLDLQGPNEGITIQNVFAPAEANKTIIKETVPPVADQRATAEVPGTGPRAQP